MPTLEVVAVLDHTIVGYGLLSEVQITNENTSHTGLVLAPLAIAPLYQKQGIGRKILTFLEIRAQELAYPFISILGHPGYYEKLNYLMAKNFHVSAPFDVPEEAFLLKPLFTDGLKEVYGTVQYLTAFDD